MKAIRKMSAALGIFTALMLTVPAFAAPMPRRDAAAQSALTTISQMQNTLTEIQKLIDGIQARHAAGAVPAPAGQ